MRDYQCVMCERYYPRNRIVGHVYTQHPALWRRMFGDLRPAGRTS